LNNVTHLFFDLDHTLWDYETNATLALQHVMQQFELHQHIEEKKFLHAYKQVNEKMWHQYNLGKIDRSDIQKYRFAEILRLLNVVIPYQPLELHECFVARCCAQPHLMPGAMEAMHYLNEKYSLSIITNGFDEPQAAKLKASRIDHFFDVVVTSETTGARKPDKSIFHHAMAQVNSLPANSVMIGDNPNTDIRGGESAGMRTIFYNPSGQRRSVTAWQIDALDQLIAIL